LGAGLARAQGGARLEVKADRVSLSPGDDATLEVVLEGQAIDSLDPPTVQGVELKGPLQRSSSMQVVNGRVTHSMTLGYRVSAEAPGTYVIGPWKALAQGQVVATAAGPTLTVRAPAPVSGQAGAPASMASKAGQPYFLLAEVGRDSAWAGEPFVVKVVLYLRLDRAVGQVSMERRPKLEGLCGEEIANDQNQARHARVGGQNFKAHTLLKTMVRGMEPGKRTIDPAKVSFVTGDFFSQRETSVSSDPVAVEIKALPEAGRPVGFEPGNLGAFNLAVRLTDESGQEPRSVIAGRRLQLEAEVSGTGNLPGLVAPRLEGGGIFEVQLISGAADSRDIVQDDSGIHGKRLFRYLLTPIKPGKHTTPTATLVTFDPGTGAYRTLLAPGKPVEVTGQELAARTEHAVLAGEDVGAIVEDASLARAGEPFVGSVGFWILAILPMAFLASMEARHRYRAHLLGSSGARRSRSAGARARERLRAAAEAQRGERVREFFDAVALAVQGYFDERAGLPAQGMTHDELRKGGEGAGYPAELMEAVIVEMENCDFARFAPSKDQARAMRETLERSEELLARLEKVAPRRHG
jgi:hypothetical protein